MIRSGLEVIGQNNLNYQIPMEDSSDEFGAITRSINSMSRQLAETVDKLYIYQLKQKTAELGELQAKFNPHFLYNTLDVICAHAYENDDQDVAEMLVLLSRIFRSFINNKSFITIQEEITFCNMYLELFRMRYKENMNIEFNVKKDVMAYGIIRNLLQPLIENYFVHGFKPQEEDNWILISATLQGPEHIVLSVSDNGFGMSPDRMQSLQEMIEDAEGETTESYGLRNLHDRVRIFTGQAVAFALREMNRAV
ncbi:MAG: sensor histidine kinase [Clostridia bacterium]